MTSFIQRIFTAMQRNDYQIDSGPGEVNIVYVPGVETDGTLNGNRSNAFDDVRVIFTVSGGVPLLLGVWEATIETGKAYTENPINPKGAARIAFGQHKGAWQVGIHHAGKASAHEALVQTGGEVTVYRDTNKDYDRKGDPTDTGYFGINQHWGYDFPKNDVKSASAGCLVGRTTAGHREFMSFVKSDPRYKSNSKFKFSTTVLERLEAAVADKPNGMRPVDIVKSVAPQARSEYVAAFEKGDALFSKYEVNTKNRMAHFLAQIMHESDGLTLTWENLNYTTSERLLEIFGSGNHSAAILQYEAPFYLRNPQELAERVYGLKNPGGKWRELGNTQPGDGYKYRGGGIMQTTGRGNYRNLGQKVGVDFEAHPEYVLTAEHALKPALAEWGEGNLNTYADRDEIEPITRKINGGYNGLTNRKRWLAKVKQHMVKPLVLDGQTVVVAPKPEPSQVSKGVLQLILEAFWKAADRYKGTK